MAAWRAKQERLFVLKNVTNSTVVCRQTRLADSFLKRLIGLIGARNLSLDSGLLIEPCSSIHTFGMRLRLDIIALDKGYQVLDIRRHIRPWRVKVFGRKTRRVLELPAGSLDNLKISVGDILRLDGGLADAGRVID